MFCIKNSIDPAVPDCKQTSAIMNGVMEQLSLLEQSRVEAPEVSDAEHVRRIAREITSQLELTAPVDFGLVTSYQGIGVVEVADIPWAGCLIDEQGQLTIKLRDIDSPHRRRFTWAHELAHTFFPGFRYQPQFRCNPGEAPHGGEADIEALCDLAAAELLFPAGSFSRDLASHGLTVHSAEELSNLYAASLEATTHRMIDLADQPALMVVLEEMNKPADRNDSTAAPQLRVSYALPNGDWPFIPKWKSADPAGLLATTLNGEVVDDVTNLSEFVQNENREVSVSAKLYPYRDNRGNLHKRVIAIYR